jgi:hypothetical protein
MKTYKMGSSEITIDIGNKYKESIKPVEYCYYYTVWLKNRYDSKMYYMDFEYLDDDTKSEDDLFQMFLNRVHPFENAIDMDGNIISSDIFESFLGKEWFDQHYTLYKLSKGR